MAHVVLNNVTRVFASGNGGTVRALDGISFEVERGEMIALAGPSGCGKTTALRIVMGLDRATSGSVLVNGRPVTGCGHDRGMVFQNAELLPWSTALDNIKFGLRMKGMSEPELTRTAQHYLELVGLGRAAGQRPRQLSGGMKQRVGLARALAIDPEILLMDEPFGALDSQTQESLQSELVSIQAKTGKTVIFVTHDLDEAIFLAHRVVVMSIGKVQEIIPIDLASRNSVNEVRATPEYGRKRAMIWDILHASQEQRP